LSDLLTSLSAHLHLAILSKLLARPRTRDLLADACADRPWTPLHPAHSTDFNPSTNQLEFDPFVPFLKL
jgi:hypothetical protein